MGFAYSRSNVTVHIRSQLQHTIVSYDDEHEGLEYDILLAQYNDMQCLNHEI